MTFICVFYVFNIEYCYEDRHRIFHLNLAYEFAVYNYTCRLSPCHHHNQRLNQIFGLTSCTLSIGYIEKGDLQTCQKNNGNNRNLNTSNTISLYNRQKDAYQVPGSVGPIPPLSKPGLICWLVLLAAMLGTLTLS